MTISLKVLLIATSAGILLAKDDKIKLLLAVMCLGAVCYSSYTHAQLSKINDLPAYYQHCRACEAIKTLHPPSAQKLSSIDCTCGHPLISINFSSLGSNHSIIKISSKDVNLSCSVANIKNVDLDRVGNKLKIITNGVWWESCQPTRAIIHAVHTSNNLYIPMVVNALCHDDRASSILLSGNCKATKESVVSVSEQNQLTM